MRRILLLSFVFHLLVFNAFGQEIRLGLPLGHTNKILSAVFSPDGKYVLTGSEDGTAKVWECSSGKLLHNVEVGQGRISAKYSPNGKYILTFDWGSVKLWKMDDGKLQYSFKGFKDKVDAIFSPDGEFFLTYDVKTVKIWNTNDGKLLFEHSEQEDQIESSYFSPDGQFIIVKYYKNIKIWSFNNGKLVYNIANSDFIFSPDGKRCVTIDSSVLNTWDFNKGNLLKSYEGFNSGISSAIFSPDGRYIYVRSDIYTDFIDEIINIPEDRIKSILVGFKARSQIGAFSPDSKHLLTTSDEGVKIWNSEDGELLQSFDGYSDEKNSAIFSPDGKKVLTPLKGQIAKVWDAYSGKLLYSLDGYPGEIQCALFSPDGKYILIASENVAMLWDANNGKLLRNFEGQTDRHYARYTPDNQNFYTVSKKAIKLFELKSGKLISNIFENNDSSNENPYQWFINTVISPDGKKILTYDNQKINVLDASDGKLLHCLKVYPGKIYVANFDPTGRYIFSTSDDNSVETWDANSGKLLLNIHEYSYQFRQNELDYIKLTDFSFDGQKILTESSFIIKIFYANNGEQILNLHADSTAWFICADLSPDGQKLIAVTQYDDLLGSIPTVCSIKIWSLSDGKLLYTLQGHKGIINSAVFSNDGQCIVTASSDTIKIWSAVDGKLIQNIERPSEINKWIRYANFSTDDKRIEVVSDKVVEIYDAYNGKFLQSIEGESNIISSFFSLDGKHILISYQNGNCILWDAHSKGKKVNYYAINNNDWLSVTPDNYYYGSKNGTSQLYWIVDNRKIYSFDQFDLQYNRPDKVLERIGLADSSIINASRKAYYKRLKKMKFDEGMFTPDFHLPETAINNLDSLSTITSNQKAILKIQATDSKYKLDRIYVQINDVPVFGMDGIDLRPLKTDSIVKEIPIELSQGDNKIQVSCLNEKGVESYKETAWVKYEPKKEIKSKLYVVSISVSQYKDAQYNLKYSVKDGRDMDRLFATHNNSASIDTLFNQDATRENILALKQKLMQTKVDDEVILYVSGHGLLDKNYDFYFATYDMNFENPAEHGILYDDLEGLLDGIPARKKLLLMDACHSGEVDKEEIEVKDTVTLADGHKGDIKTYGYKGTLPDQLQNSGLGLKNSFELMQELFANLTRGSGAVVISAAAGTGYALESPEWNNGVFTYCIINGLKNMAADANKDGQVTVSELKDYVSSEVEKLTNGAQKPTSRRESLEFDWRVW